MYTQHVWAVIVLFRSLQEFQDLITLNSKIQDIFIADTLSYVSSGWS